MLVLSRKEGETIRIGENIVITVVRLSGDKVRLGIEAPADVSVMRTEVLEAIAAAAAAAPPDAAAASPPAKPKVVRQPSREQRPTPGQGSLAHRVQARQKAAVA